jgi:hypothetical protein
MRSYETCIKSCSEEYIYHDKKLRERRYKLDKYIIVLDENAPFARGDRVMVISEEDFQKLFQAVKKLKRDKTELMGQIEDLRTTVQFSKVEENQSQYICLIKKIKNCFR